MANILTNAETAAYLGLSATDPVIPAVIATTEAIAANDCWFDTLSAPDPDADGDDEFTYAGCGPYYLRLPNPHGTLTVDGQTAPDYRIDGRRLVFATPPAISDTTWGKIRFSYRYGWTTATAPAKLKAALLSLASFCNAKRTSEWIRDFSQGELRIAYETASATRKLPDVYETCISAFRKFNANSDDTATRYMP